MVRTNYISAIQFYIVLMIWLAAGMVNKWIPFGLIPLSVFAFYRKEFYREILLGFVFILILSDSLEPQLEFAKSFKNIYILMLSFISLADERIRSEMRYYFKSFIPFFIVAAACLFFSPVPDISIQKTISYVLLFLSVPAYVIFLIKHENNDFLRDLLLFLMMILLAGIMLMFVSYDVAISHGGRLRGLFGNPNGLGVFILLAAILLVIVRTKDPFLFSRYGWMFWWLLVLYCAFASGSRTTLLGVFFFLLFIRFSQVSGFLTLLVFFILLMSTEFILHNLTEVTNTLGLQRVLRADTLDEGSGRFIAWGFAWQNIKQSLFMGKGFAFDEFLMRSNFDYLSKLGHEGGVHNTYLILWLNTGLVGLIMFLRGFFLTFIHASKSTKLAIPVMLTVMFSINFEPWLASSLNPFTILFLIAITLMGESFAFKSENKHEVAEENS